ncbi:MAG TPA: C40 family peptidase [Gemmatimonadaceae bacterium]|nr:C40 family peptidase [Gemmatimonadaceae bacterium]
MIRRLTVAAIGGTTTVALTAFAANAQSRYELSPFAARNASLAGTPTLMGASLTTYSGRLGGILGMRVGGAYDVRALAGSTTSSDTERGWTADVDGVISPSRFPVIGPLLGGFIPTLFSGIGVEGIRRNAGESAQTIVTSYGMGVSRSIGGISIDTEARRRTPVSWSGSATDATSVARRGWEYRVGISIGFGGRSNPGAGLPGIPLPSGSRSTRRSEPAPSASARAVLATGDTYVGTRYTYGGESPQAGFDCSGFVQYVFRRHGLTLPRTSRQQSTAGRSISSKLAHVRAGDLLFFSQRGDVVDHVAIYAGDNRILHSSSSGDGVRYDDLGSARGRWFVDRLVAARRVLGEDTRFIDPGVTARLDVKLDPPDLAPKP